jgi:hypothetical protein
LPPSAGGGFPSRYTAADVRRAYGPPVLLVTTGSGTDFRLALASVEPSLVVAVIGLVVAVAAALWAKQSADAADHTRNMARQEHEVFLRERRARARFTLNLAVRHPTPDKDGVIRTDGSGVFAVVEVGLTNEGDRAAGQTTLKVLAPPQAEQPMWCGPGGESVSGRRSAADTTETLTDPNDGSQLTARYLDEVLPRVGQRYHPVRHFCFRVDLSDRRSVAIPLRFCASADELPDDEPAPVVDEVVRIEQQASSL